MPNEETIAFSKHRVERAKESIAAADVMIHAGYFLESIGRSYYAIFYLMRAVLAIEGVDFKKHSGVISHFQKEYVKTGVFDIKFSDYVKEAFGKRQATDYRDFYIVSKSEAEEQLAHAKEMLEAVENHLRSIWEK
ncbi:DNA-binding protein [Clostridia bacterium]|nr:DNA-binding protein [Clostridia bacterium]